MRAQELRAVLDTVKPEAEVAVWVYSDDKRIRVELKKEDLTIDNGILFICLDDPS